MCVCVCVSIIIPAILARVYNTYSGRSTKSRHRYLYLKPTGVRVEHTDGALGTTQCLGRATQPSQPPHPASDTPKTASVGNPSTNPLSCCIYLHQRTSWKTRPSHKILGKYTDSNQYLIYIYIYIYVCVCVCVMFIFYMSTPSSTSDVINH